MVKDHNLNFTFSLCELGNYELYRGSRIDYEEIIILISLQELLNHVEQHINNAPQE